MAEKEAKRGQWSSTLGFILAAAGSAVGLGNLWKFPYLAGKNGGGAYLFVYLFFVMIIGFTMILAEMAIGRNGQSDAFGAFKKVSENWKYLGLLQIFISFLILSYYSVIGGWVLKYVFAFLKGGIAGDKAAYFTSYISSTNGPIIFHLFFMVATAAIVFNGVSSGIEKASKFMMPALFGLLILICLRSVTLPGAGAGIKFFLKPDFSKINGSVALDALSQVFYSLSLAMGITVTYGSYLRKEENLLGNATKVPILDTIVAMLAGFAILPAVFALGFKPGAGPGLMFITLPAVFEQMAFGKVFGLMFFVLVLFAALTSSISLLEVSTSLLVDQFKMKRQKAVAILTVALFLLGVPSSLSMGVWADLKIFFGMNFFDFLCYLTDNVCLPISGLLTCIFIGYVWKKEDLYNQITNDNTIKFTLFKVWFGMLRYVAPVVLIVILLKSLGFIHI
ncbi:MAG: sodium-dependent transporter [Fusobacterium sp. JB021]|nr:sodium-dependent transporter [Fusobacterium sp. JB020]MDP0493696.1 sodium-dependent transporter [Fusobacterium sp. JB021]MDP0507492.1 sodium-dependent transporter [Fusobacterium sp. JB019]